MTSWVEYMILAVILCGLSLALGFVTGCGSGEDGARIQICTDDSDNSSNEPEPQGDVTCHQGSDDDQDNDTNGGAS